jgi:hypothetical protein
MRHVHNDGAAVRSGGALRARSDPAAHDAMWVRWGGWLAWDRYLTPGLVRSGCRPESHRHAAMTADDTGMWDYRRVSVMAIPEGS